jgi:hypothetical protein
MAPPEAADEPASDDTSVMAARSPVEPTASNEPRRQDRPV